MRTKCGIGSCFHVALALAVALGASALRSALAQVGSSTGTPAKVQDAGSQAPLLAKKRNALPPAP